MTTSSCWLFIYLFTHIHKHVYISSFLWFSSSSLLLPPLLLLCFFFFPSAALGRLTRCSGQEDPWAALHLFQNSSLLVPACNGQRAHLLCAISSLTCRTGF